MHGGEPLLWRVSQAEGIDRYARLPFGWSYSLAICQVLVTAVIRRVLGRKGIKGWVYLDDILLSARSRRRLHRGVRECIHRLRAAGFIVGGKSEPSPKEQITFIGKRIDTREGIISNSVGALIGAFRTWIRGVGRGQLPSKATESFLGKVCWLARPNAGLGAFLAGSYSSMRSGLGRFGRATAKGPAIALLFACVPQYVSPLGDGCEPEWEVFVDAAHEEDGFRIEVVGGKGLYISQLCPPLDLFLATG